MSSRFLQLVSSNRTNLVRFTQRSLATGTTQVPPPNSAHRLTQEEKEKIQGKHGVTGTTSDKKSLDESGGNRVPPKTTGEAYKQANQELNDPHRKNADMAYGVTDAAKQTMHNIKERTMESAHNLKEAIKDKASGLAEKAKETVDKAAQKIHEKTAKTSESVKETVEKTKDEQSSEGIGGKINKAADKTKETIDKAAQKVHEKTASSTESMKKKADDEIPSGNTYGLKD